MQGYFLIPSSPYGTPYSPAPCPGPHSPIIPKSLSPSSSSTSIHQKHHRKNKFTREEDDKLTLIVQQLGDTNWKRIADQMGTRNYRQCRERWKNYLSPSVSKDPWTKEQDKLLLEKFNEYGSQWSLIVRFFPNRTDVNIKNRWVVLTNHSIQEKRVRRKPIKSANDHFQFNNSCLSQNLNLNLNIMNSNSCISSIANSQNYVNNNTTQSLCCSNNSSRIKNESGNISICQRCDSFRHFESPHEVVESFVDNRTTEDDGHSGVVSSPEMVPEELDLFGNDLFGCEENVSHLFDLDFSGLEF
ncbi:hypothetical protein TRFO_40718 [Tritrichomonas foetus]|uniref:Myb-like DNA-binding domain containing protein n=1 Tax=Tritrichomonas foetus TaxID=1144522 RepID=A0A1J4J2F9_9EUKA|nr:hypothetical protein TRFO_40718 [Tritrichomonas foetus]|eukprot:OHS92929.1 hypothetical protein TRFO_40718 [Tritrichomonas foetus]